MKVLLCLIAGLMLSSCFGSDPVGVVGQSGSGENWVKVRLSMPVNSCEQPANFYVDNRIVMVLNRHNSPDTVKILSGSVLVAKYGSGTDCSPNMNSIKVTNSIWWGYYLADSPDAIAPF